MQFMQLVCHYIIRKKLSSPITGWTSHETIFLVETNAQSFFNGGEKIIPDKKKY